MTAIENIINQIENETRRFGNTKTRVAAVLRLIKAKLVELFSGKLDKGRYTGTADDLNNTIGNKVDKVPGKILSSNDFTNELRTKLEGLQNVDISGLLPKGGYTGTAQNLKELIDNIMRILQSPDTELDELREIVAFIKQNKRTLDTLGISNIAGLQDALNGKAPNDHHHDDRYSQLGHTHTEYAPKNHRHNWDDIDGKPDFNYLSLTGGTVNGDITANSIIKKNSSNDKVLLGGGGDINLSELKNDNVKIGGRNLALNTGSIGEINISNTSQAVSHGLRYIMEKLQKDELCMLSFDAKTVLPNTSSRLHIESYGDNSKTPGNGIAKIEGNVYKRYSVYVKLLDISNKNLFVWLTEKESDVLIRDFKLYRGTQIEDWSPAPEDIRIATEISGVRKILPHENIVYATANVPNCDLQLIPSGYSVAFRKVFAGGTVTFTCAGKQIIYTGDTDFNGGDGSTAVVSIWNNKCYIDIRNV
nr:MAG TPA: tail repeat-like protein [Caudoviricetes sp.]